MGSADWSGQFECVGEAGYQGGRVGRKVVVRVRRVVGHGDKKGVEEREDQDFIAEVIPSKS